MHRRVLRVGVAALALGRHATWPAVLQREGLESPAVVYGDRGRIVMVGPELVAGYPVRLVIEPNPGAPQRGKAGGASSESLLVTVFAKTTPPLLPSVDRLASDGTLRFLHMQNAPEIWRRAGAQFPRQAALSLGRKKTLTEKNLAGYRRNPGGAMSRAAAGAGLPVANVTRLADAVRRTWANAPEVVVVSGMQDPRVPQRVRDHDAEQRSQGAVGEPEGFYYGGRIYLVAAQLSSPADVVRVLAHEALGHHGLHGFFGSELGKILDQIAVVRRAEVDAKRHDYGLPDTAAGRRVAAEEVLAIMAQTNPQLGFVQRAVAAIRAWLHGLRVKLRISDNDIIAKFIIPARQWVQWGGDVVAEGTPVATFSRRAVEQGYITSAQRKGARWSSTRRRGSQS